MDGGDSVCSRLHGRPAGSGIWALWHHSLTQHHALPRPGQYLRARTSNPTKVIMSGRMLKKSKSRNLEEWLRCINYMIFEMLWILNFEFMTHSIRSITHTQCRRVSLMAACWNFILKITLATINVSKLSGATTQSALVWKVSHKFDVAVVRRKSFILPPTFCCPQDSHLPPLGRVVLPRPSMCHTSSLQTPMDKEQALQVSVSGFTSSGTD